MCSLCDIENQPEPMDLSLHQQANVLRTRGVELPEAVTNIPQMAKVMVLVAREVANINQTGLLWENIEQDAGLLLYAAMTGIVRL